MADRSACNLSWRGLPPHNVAIALQVRYAEVNVGLGLHGNIIISLLNTDDDVTDPVGAVWCVKLV